MGLTVSHGAYKGSYMGFGHMRQEVARAMGGSFPPHWQMDDNQAYKRDPHGSLMYDKTLPHDKFFVDEDLYNPDTHPGLFAFLSSADSAWEIHPSYCLMIANELEALLPKIRELPKRDVMHDDIVKRLETFIAGCRVAHAMDEDLEFR